MHIFIMKNLWLILLALLSCTIAQESEVVEGESLRKLPARDFLEIHAGLKERFGNKFTFTDGVRHLKLVEHEISGIEIPEEVAKQMFIKEDSVDFVYLPYAFYFDITYLYEYTLAAFPMTGLVRIRYIATQATYSLHVVDMVSLVPYLSTPWNIRSTYNSNPIALILGVNDALTSMIIKVLYPHYDAAIKKLLVTRVAAYYQSYYTHKVTYLRYPFLKNTVVRIRDDLTVAFTKPDGVHFAYDTEANRYLPYAITGSEEPYLRKIAYSHESLARILSVPPARIQGLTVYPEDISPDSMFQLDLKAVQHIFPDILLANPPTRKVSMSFTATKSDLKHSFNPDEQTVTFGDLWLKLIVYLHDPDQEILRAVVKLNATLRPVITCDTNCTEVKLHLEGMKADAKLVEAESKLTKEALFNPAAVPSFVRGFTEQYLLKYHNMVTLGEGLKVSSGYKVDIAKAKTTVNDKAVEVELYQA